MQLFHIDKDCFIINGESLNLVGVPELLSQLRKVLRCKKGDHICVQFCDNEKTNRFEISIEDWTDKDLIGKIINRQDFHNGKKDISMLIAMPNKREKAELIVQKLTEIGVNNIFFRAAEHSIIRQRNEKKTERLDKISREAVEQSRGKFLPYIKFLNKNELIDFIKGKEIYLANMNGKKIGDYKSDGFEICGIIGPEGGFSKDDLELFSDAKIIDLGENILRMETAAIVLAWILKN